MFRCFWDCFVALRNTVQNGPNWCNQCKRSCHAVAMEYFANNAPDPPHWTLNSCFGVFRIVWVHLGPFRRLIKIRSKWAELVRLMPKFVPWNRVRTFYNERSWSTPLDSKLMFWCVLLCLGAFGTVSTPYKTRFKTGRTGVINAKIRAANSHWNFSQQTDLIHPIGP